MSKAEEFKRKNKQLTELSDLIDNAAKEISDFMHTDIPFQKYTDLSISAIRTGAGCISNLRFQH